MAINYSWNMNLPAIVNIWTHFGNNTCRLMSRDHPFSFLSPYAAAMIFMQVAAAKTGNLHLNDYLP